MSLYLGEKLVSGIGQDRIADTLPIGAIIEWDSDLIPENWLLLNGQAVSRTVYSELFALYGTKYGAGDGSTTFNLPDRRTRVSVGRDINDSDFNILGNKGGEKSHTLSISEMPDHGHNRIVYNGNSQWSVGDNSGLGGTQIDGYSRVFTSGSSNSIDSQSSHWRASNTGGSQPHNNLQPYIVTNFIVKAKLYTTEFIGGNLVIDNLTSDSSVNVLSARMGKELHEEIRPITAGGTGANNAEQALKNLGGISMELIWQNASPESTFGEQTINLNLSEYDQIAVDFRFIYPSVPYHITQIEYVGATSLACGIWGNSGQGIYGAYRSFTFLENKTGVKFNNAWKPTATSETQDNNCMIPYAIYGIKGVK